MKYDPDSKVRSQRENMQAYQLRLPKEVIRDIQILRVFAGVKVSEELRDLVIAYVNERQPLIQKAAVAVMPINPDEEHRRDADALIEGGDANEVETRAVKKVRVEVDGQGNRTLVELPMTEDERRVQRKVRRSGS
jgi:hypothetical protein